MLAVPTASPLTFHSLRQHFASWFMMRGGRLEALQRILGRASLQGDANSPDYLRHEMVKTEAQAGAEAGRNQHMTSTKRVESPLPVA